MTRIAERPPLSVAKTWLGLIRCFPGLYALTTAIRIFVFVGIFQATGLIIRFFFDSLTASAPLAWGPNAWAALMLAVALFRNGLILIDMYVFFRWTFSTAATMRKNLIEHILSMPGARVRCPAQPARRSAASARMRRRWATLPSGRSSCWQRAYLAWWRCPPWRASTCASPIFAFLPLVFVLIVANLARSKVQQYREANRASTGNVTGFIGEMFESIQAVQVAAAEESVLAHFRGAE